MLEHDPGKWKPVFRMFVNRPSPPPSKGTLPIFPKPDGLCNRFPQVSARLGYAYAPRISR
jgi:hypothetical protein